MLTLDLLFPWQYKRWGKRPVQKNKAVFIEANLSSLSNSLKFLYQEMEKSGEFQVAVHCLREAFVSKYTYIRNAIGCLKDMADAEYIFLCEGSRLVSCITPRRETVIAQLWHGCGAFKRFGFSTSDLLFGGNRRENTKYSYYKNYDCVTVSSPEVVWAYQEAMNLPQESETIRPLGVSRTDVFFREDFRKAAKERILEQVPDTAGKKILLYAPTFRGSVGNAKAPDELDLCKMKESLGEAYCLLIKHHPVVKARPKIPEAAAGFAYDVSDLCTIEDLICVSDLCISDYSSLVFEYSLMQRPMIFFAYDLEEYGDWRGFYYDYHELTPGPVVKTTEEMIDLVRQGEEGFDMEKVRQFREKFMKACDGHATERILETVRRLKDECNC